MSELPTSEWTRINTAAERFERAWKYGQRPQIEDFLVEEDLEIRLLQSEAEAVILYDPVFPANPFAPPPR
jgi:hypothetical protein